MSKKKQILIIDDSSFNRKVLEKLIIENTSYDVSMAENATDGLKFIESTIPDLILLDVVMPGLDGFELSKLLKNNPRTKNIPIIFITSKSDEDTKVQAFKVGCIDFIAKPFNKNELLAILDAQIRIKEKQDIILEKNKLLEDRELHLMSLVEMQTKKIENLTLSLIGALENANQMNDMDTGNHIKRVSLYAFLIAKEYGCDFDFAKRIKLYASLHDVGKISIPDKILKKPGKYTDDEFNEMKKHVIYGANLLSDSEIDNMAKNIALYHHEKWDGSGYLTGLMGKEIPIEARIVAIADVYDALITKRVYKEAFPDEKALEIILQGSGNHFEPKIVDVFKNNYDEIKDIKNSLFL